MRSKLLILTAGLTALVVPAQAQDVLGWSKPSVDWSGFYAGVFGGYGLDVKNASVTTVDFEVDDVRYEGLVANSRIATGFGGAEMGYDFQAGPVVFGLNADLTVGAFSKAAGYSGRATSLDPLFPGEADFEGLTTWDASAIGTVAGRLGVAAGNWLVYGTAGLAVADVTVQGSVTSQVVGVPASAQLQIDRTTGLLFGSVLGIGVEGMVTDNVSIGAEYNYIAFADRGSNAQPIPLGPLVLGPPALGAVSLHTLKVGAKYHF